MAATINLTKRRREFLDKIWHQYQTTNLPVHYSEVAEAIGVSKWTAYDVLKTLESQGLLKRTYATNENETGRSVVVFSPTEMADHLFQKERRIFSNPEEWEMILNQATNLIENQQNLPLMDGINNILEQMKNVDVKLEFCAYFLCVLIIFLKSLGNPVKELTVNVVNASQESKVQLTVFVGAVVGMIIQSVGEELSPEMVTLVQQFFDNANQLNSKELDILISFIKQS
ncbi:MarR family winged helix-turn-helix transcriptional regulator [Neobacillus sp. WH10]|uniref:MarR family winged helix-turn-helix transcriptional regulator n=1 Tax=Neobacillus sp. WH10 TaxID=3047873 RepID=UPI0024C1C27F|nr:MarR family winged helix-turn-helix transcriptional regulator [Neobacillus sp. WH10]WHY75318.1 MarR family winged helix-turn-helix transcriptional regulator [Neobacillus sp. WH10]